MPVIVTRGAASLKALGFAGAGKPLAPTIGTPTRTSASISVLFTPGYNGGAPVTVYTVTSTPGNYIFTGSSSPIAATGMTLGTSYTFTVRATNVYGDSPESESSTSIKYASVPLAPTIGTATITSPTAVNVTFTAGANGGEPITSYTAVALVGGIIHGEFGRIFQAGSGTIPVTGLTSGVSYTFKVLAANVLGNGVYSAETGNTTPDLPTYNISSNLYGMVGGDIMSEGETASFYIDTNETVTATTLYWSVSGTGITAADFVSGSLTGNVSILPASRATVSMTTANDLTTEGQETFTLRFYTNAGRTTLLTDAVIGGYVIGNEKTVNVTDSSTVGFSINPGVSSINEGGSVTFTVTRTDGASSTAYWGVQGVSGSINTSDFSSTQGSVSISSGTGTFSVTVTSDQVTEGAESFRVGIWAESAKLTLLAISATVTINDTSVYPAYGTYQGQFCSGYNLYYIYADGSGGTYNQLQQTNSPTCGYAPPTLAAYYSGVSEDFVSYTPNAHTQQYWIVIHPDASAGYPQYWSVSGLNQAALLSGGGAGSSTSGTFNSVYGSAIVFQTPHPATYVTYTVSRSGYTSYSTSILIPANNVLYSPYDYFNGFMQEMGRYGNALIQAFGIGDGIYASTSNAWTVDYQDGLGPRVRYSFGRAPDAGGLNFWVGYCIGNGYNWDSPAFVNIIIQSGEIAGENVFTGSKAYNAGTGYGKFSNRPTAGGPY